MTTLKFTYAKIDQTDEGLRLSVLLDKSDIQLARKFVMEQKDKLYDMEIKEHREKRSLDANAYFWTLADKLAEATGVPKIEVYRSAIRDIGGNNTTVCVPEAAEKRLRSGWEKNGIGWITESMPSKLPGCVNVTLYYGSSTYSVAQMGRLIDNIIQDCKAVGIETMTEERISLLKEEWGNA